MMRIITTILFFCALINTNDAQIFDQISRSIDRAIDKEVGKMSDRVAEKMIEKIFQKMFEGEEVSTDTLDNYEVDTSSSSSNVDLSSIFGSSSKKVDKAFTFDYKLKMKVGQPEKTNTYDYYLPATGTYTAMEVKNIFVITDFETGESYTILNDQLTSFNMTKMIEKFTVNKMDENAEDVSITKTGKVEMIAGYSCEEYLMSTEDSKNYIWITHDFVSLDLQSAALIEMIKEKSATPKDTGFAMRMIYEVPGEETTIMEVQSVEKVEKTIDLSEY